MFPGSELLIQEIEISAHTDLQKEQGNVIKAKISVYCRGQWTTGVKITKSPSLLFVHFFYGIKRWRSLITKGHRESGSLFVC